MFVAVMHSQTFSQSGAALSRLMIGAVVALALILATQWLVTYFYSTEWAATDPRGFAGKASLVEPPKTSTETPATESAAALHYQSFKAPAEK